MVACSMLCVCLKLPFAVCWSLCIVRGVLCRVLLFVGCCFCSICVVCWSVSCDVRCLLLFVVSVFVVCCLLCGAHCEMFAVCC